MATMFRCECGQEVRGDSDEELLAAVARHLACAHKDLPATLSRQALLAMAVDEPERAPFSTERNDRR